MRDFLCLKLGGGFTPINKVYTDCDKRSFFMSKIRYKGDKGDKQARRGELV